MDQVSSCFWISSLIPDRFSRDLTLIFFSPSFRDEDRAILIELKTKGASRETFSALSERLNKPSAQVGCVCFLLYSNCTKDEHNN